MVKTPRYLHVTAMKYTRRAPRRFDDAHFRRMRNMLTKKLESMV